MPRPRHRLPIHRWSYWSRPGYRVRYHRPGFADYRDNSRHWVSLHSIYCLDHWVGSVSTLGNTKDTLNKLAGFRAFRKGFHDDFIAYFGYAFMSEVTSVYFGGGAIRIGDRSVFKEA